MSDTILGIIIGAGVTILSAVLTFLFQIVIGNRQFKQNIEKKYF